MTSIGTTGSRETPQKPKLQNSSRTLFLHFYAPLSHTVLQKPQVYRSKVICLSLAHKMIKTKQNQAQNTTLICFSCIFCAHLITKCPKILSANATKPNQICIGTICSISMSTSDICACHKLFSIT